MTTIKIKSIDYELANFSDIYFIPISRFFEDQSLANINAMAELIKKVLIVNLPDNLIDSSYVIRGLTSAEIRDILVALVSEKVEDKKPQNEIELLKHRLAELEKNTKHGQE